MWQCLLAAVILAAPVSSKSEKPKKLTPYEKALKAATEAEIAELDKQIADAEKRSTAPASTRQAIRAKVLARKEVKKLKKRRLGLKKGKILPKLELDPFAMKDGQLGKLQVDYMDGDVHGKIQFTVDDASNDAILVIASKTMTRTYVIGSGTRGTARFRKKSIERKSPPFCIHGMKGVIGKQVTPQGLWIVSLRGGYLHLTPITPPTPPKSRNAKTRSKGR